MNMLRLEYDIQHHVVLSRKNSKDHALIRMIVSTLSTPEELSNLNKKDFKKVKGRKLEFYTVKLNSSGKSRISPVDEKTYNLIMSLEDNKPFEYSRDEINSIVSKYSPTDRKYCANNLRSAMLRFLRDASLFEVDIEDLQDYETLYAFMMDFNPLYSGIWELEDDEIAEDFILNYATLNKIEDARIIAEELGESEERVKKILESGKKGLLSLPIDKLGTGRRRN